MKDLKEKEAIEDKLDEIERKIKGAHQRWLDVDNPFWEDFIFWVRHRVKKKASSNPYRFVPCCWSFQKRKRNGYQYHSETSTFNYYLVNNTTFKKYFLALAIEYGWAANKKIYLPTIDAPHLERSESPSFLNKRPQIDFSDVLNLILKSTKKHSCQ